MLGLKSILHDMLACKQRTKIVCCHRRAALALAAGCVYRSKGGMSLQLGISNTVATLTAVSQACKGAVQLWVLHGLCLTANAAGLAFVPFCKVRAIFASACKLILAVQSIHLV